MHRKSFIRGTVGLGLSTQPVLQWLGHPEKFQVSSDPAFQGLKKPVFVYNNWSAYDELSDKVAQTEALAMKELQELIRMKKNGVRIDYYVMDAFWFDIDGGYRTWHKEHWPNGPDGWLAACRENHLQPGMWFSTNLVSMGGRQALNILPEWKDSLGTDPNILCLFDGGYLQHLSGSLELWYDKGVRLFKFDFAYFEAVTPRLKDTFTKAEVLEKNKGAFMGMLQAFRKRHPDILLTGYNGFGGDMENTFTPLDKKIDTRWLDTFDTLYCGDPRFSDVPMINIWRSQDNYSDHQVNAFQAYGMPLRRIDNCAFMTGKTGTCYYRGTHCWKGMLILELARGGWMNVYHGNLELLSDPDAAWFAKVQQLYLELQEENKTETFGALPGKGKPYGFHARGTGGQLITVVNPSQETAEVPLPVSVSQAKILYADGGFVPTWNGKQIRLGPEQLAVIGFGRYAVEKYDMGRDDSIQIPRTITRAPADFQQEGRNRVKASVMPNPHQHLRIIFQQFEPNGNPRRSWGGSPPDGKKMNELLRIEASQDGHAIPLHIEYDQMIWSGLSWAAAEIADSSLEVSKPLEIRCSSAETDALILKAEVYWVSY